MHAEERWQAGIPLQVRVPDRRDCTNIYLRRFRGSLDCSPLSEPRRRTRRRVPRSAAGARNGKALSAHPGRRDEALRRAALARAHACGGAAWPLRRDLSIVVLDPANSSTVRFWNSKGQCAFCAEKRPRERCIFPGAGIKFKRKCAGSLLRGVSVMRRIHQHTKEEIQMASKRTYTWGVLLGLAALPGLAFANQEVIKLTQDSKNWAMQAGNMQNQRYSALKQINKTNVKNL